MNCYGSGTILTGEPCPICQGTGKGSGPSEFHMDEQLEPVIRAGGWVKALLKAIWGSKSEPS